MRCSDQVIFSHQVGNQLTRWQVVYRLQVSNEMQALAADFIVEDQFRQTEGEHEIQHARTGYRIHTGYCGQQGTAERLATSLSIEELAITQRHVGLSWQVQRLGNRDIGNIEMLGLYCCHRRTRRFHMEGCWRTTKYHRRARSNDLRHGQTG